jgi:hypothetical protein
MIEELSPFGCEVLIPEIEWAIEIPQVHVP